MVGTVTRSRFKLIAVDIANDKDAMIELIDFDWSPKETMSDRAAISTAVTHVWGDMEKLAKCYFRVKRH